MTLCFPRRPLTLAIVAAVSLAAPAAAARSEACWSARDVPADHPFARAVKARAGDRLGEAAELFVAALERDPDGPLAQEAELCAAALGGRAGRPEIVVKAATIFIAAHPPALLAKLPRGDAHHWTMTWVIRAHEHVAMGRQMLQDVRGAAEADLDLVRFVTATVGVDRAAARGVASPTSYAREALLRASVRGELLGDRDLVSRARASLVRAGATAEELAVVDLRAALAAGVALRAAPSSMRARAAAAAITALGDVVARWHGSKRPELAPLVVRAASQAAELVREQRGEAAALPWCRRAVDEARALGEPPKGYDALGEARAAGAECAARVRVADARLAVDGACRASGLEANQDLERIAALDKEVTARTISDPARAIGFAEVGARYDACARNAERVWPTGEVRRGALRGALRAWLGVVIVASTTQQPAPADVDPRFARQRVASLVDALGDPVAGEIWDELVPRTGDLAPLRRALRDHPGARLDEPSDAAPPAPAWP